MQRWTQASYKKDVTPHTIDSRECQKTKIGKYQRPRQAAERGRPENPGLGNVDMQSSRDENKTQLQKYTLVDGLEMFTTKKSASESYQLVVAKWSMFEVQTSTDDN